MWYYGISLSYSNCILKRKFYSLLCDNHVKVKKKIFIETAVINGAGMKKKYFVHFGEISTLL